MYCLSSLYVASGNSTFGWRRAAVNCKSHLQALVLDLLVLNEYNIAVNGVIQCLKMQFVFH